MNEISDCMIHIVGAALLRYHERINARAREGDQQLPAFNVAKAREGGWRMFAEGWISMICGDNGVELKLTASHTKRDENRCRHRPIVARYLDMAAHGAFDRAPEQLGEGAQAGFH